MWIIILSLVVNYFGIRLFVNLSQQSLRNLGVAALVSFNVVLICAFKYLGLIFGTFGDLTGIALTITTIALPLGISFFSFQQITYVVDFHRGGRRDDSFVDYSLAVLFFPHLIAGPIVKYRVLIDQPVPRHFPPARCRRDQDAQEKFKAYPIGYFHIDIAEVRTEEGLLYMFAAIDRTSKLVFVELHEKATGAVAADFLKRLVEAVPYTIHTVLTDNGTHFTTRGNIASAASLIKEAIERGEAFCRHAFEIACARLDIDHRLTKPYHPWTNGQVERMNRTLKEATARRYYYETHAKLRQHLAAFVDAYIFAKRLKTLKGMPPSSTSQKCWTDLPKRFRLCPAHQFPGLNI